MIDNRVIANTALLGWVKENFENTGLQIGYDEAGDGDIDQTATLFKQHFAPGTVTITAGTQDARNMFGIAVIPFDPTIDPPPSVSITDWHRMGRVGDVFEIVGTITDSGPILGDPLAPLSYSWVFASGSSSGLSIVSTDTTEGNVTTVTSTITALADGYYALRLRAEDGTSTVDANAVVDVRPYDPETDGLISHWAFENDLIDSVSSYDGTPVGIVTYTDGAIGQAVQLINSFDADVNPPVHKDEPNYIHIDMDAPKLDQPAPTEFTVTAWVKMAPADTAFNDNLGYMNIFSKGADQSNGIRYLLKTYRGHGRFVTDDNITKFESEGSTVINDNLWHCIIGVSDGIKNKVYVDGILEDTDYVSAGYDLSGTSMQHAFIGAGIATIPTDNGAVADPNNANINTKEWNGLIDDLRVYNYTLLETDTTGADSIASITAMAPLAPRVSVVFADENIDSPWQYFIGQEIGLDGTVTDNGLNGTSDHIVSWSVSNYLTPEGEIADGTSFASFTDPTMVDTNVSFTKFGTYTLELSVQDRAANATITASLVIELISPTCEDVKAAGLIMPADLNQDCKVDIDDFLIFAANFLLCNDPENPDCTWPF